MKRKIFEGNQANVNADLALLLMDETVKVTSIEVTVHETAYETSSVMVVVTYNTEAM